MREYLSAVFQRFPSFSLSLDLRRGTLTLINIGGPIIAGLLSGESSAGLVGGITGLLLTLSDTEGPLFARLATTDELLAEWSA